MTTGSAQLSTGPAAPSPAVAGACICHESPEAWRRCPLPQHDHTQWTEHGWNCPASCDHPDAVAAHHPGISEDDGISISPVLPDESLPLGPLLCEANPPCERDAEWRVAVRVTDDGESWVLCPDHTIDVVRENLRMLAGIREGRDGRMNITKTAKCPDCGGSNVKRLGVDPGSHEDLYECRDCGQVADKSDF